MQRFRISQTQGLENKTRVCTVQSMKFSPVVALLAGTMVFTAPSAAAADVDDTAYDRVIITYDAPVSAQSLNARTDVTDVRATGQSLKGVKSYRLARPVQGGEAVELLADLERTPGVKSADFDMRVHTAAVPNDTLWGDQWALHGEFGMDAEEAWVSSEGAGVTVAVVDTGIRGEHEDLTGQWVGGYDFITDLTTANDGDGADADPSDPGDWTTTENCDQAGPSSWHGSHVAGIIAATKNNSKGVAGAASGAKILPVRALGVCGGSMYEILMGASWAAGLSVSGVPANPNPAKIINMSLGGSGMCPSWVQTIIDEITAAGSLVVAAAGNENFSASVSTPANCNNVLAVASTTNTGNKSSFSNWGSVVGVAAPGSAIMSTVDSGTTTPTGAAYDALSGTSMAAPNVAAVAALVASLQPSISPSALATRLKTTATPFPDGSTCATKCGSGIINARAAVAATMDALKPGAPLAVSAVPRGSALRVSWSAPAPTSDLAVTGYTVALDGSDRCSTAATTCDITGLSRGSSHSVSVRASNTAGSGPASAAITAVYALIPEAPIEARVVMSGTTATLNWSAPLDDGGSPLTGYRVSVAPSGSCTTTTRECVFTDLTVGAVYSFSVWSQNVAGESGASAATSVQVPLGAAAPNTISAQAGNDSLNVSWTPGSGGLPVLRYVATATPGGYICTSTTTNCTITGLSPGTAYSITVAAVPTTGATSTSSAVTVTTTGTAQAPAPAATPYRIKKGARVLASKVLSSTAAGSKSWRVSGSCRVAGRYLVAPRKATRCTLTLTVKGTETRTSRRTVIVS